MGSHSSTDTIETVDFECLLQAMDEFAEEIKATRISQGEINNRLLNPARVPTKNVNKR